MSRTIVTDSGLVRDPVGPAPVRRPRSVRRTSSIDTSWPDGREGDMVMDGRCRDLRTGAALGEVDTVREDRMHARLGWDRVIHSIGSERRPLERLVGARGGGHLRAVLDDVIHDERMNGSPLYLLLDDISGASLVAGWVWSRWSDNWMRINSSDEADARRSRMENICTGFATGSSALEAHRGPNNFAQVVGLPNPDDAYSFHTLPSEEGVNMRRARRIDVWREDDLLYIDVGFQDSGSDPELKRVAIHEYQLNATADAASGELLTIEAIPRVLPFPECPGAVANIQRLVGTPLTEMRTAVIDMLPGTLGCTHLNDVLRGLAEVPVLAGLLDARNEA